MGKVKRELKENSEQKGKDKDLGKKERKQHVQSTKFGEEPQ